MQFPSAKLPSLPWFITNSKLHISWSVLCLTQDGSRSYYHIIVVAHQGVSSLPNDNTLYLIWYTTGSRRLIYSAIPSTTSSHTFHVYSACFSYISNSKQYIQSYIPCVLCVFFIHQQFPVLLPVIHSMCTCVFFIHQQFPVLLPVIHSMCTCVFFIHQQFPVLLPVIHSMCTCVFFIHQQFPVLLPVIHSMCTCVFFIHQQFPVLLPVIHSMCTCVFFIHQQFPVLLPVIHSMCTCVFFIHQQFPVLLPVIHSMCTLRIFHTSAIPSTTSSHTFHVYLRIFHTSAIPSTTSSHTFHVYLRIFHTSAIPSTTSSHTFHVYSAYFSYISNSKYYIQSYIPCVLAYFSYISNSQYYFQSYIPCVLAYFSYISNSQYYFQSYIPCVLCVFFIHQQFQVLLPVIHSMCTLRIFHTSAIPSTTSSHTFHVYSAYFSYISNSKYYIQSYIPCVLCVFFIHQQFQVVHPVIHSMRTLRIFHTSAIPSTTSSHTFHVVPCVFFIHNSPCFLWIDSCYFFQRDKVMATSLFIRKFLSDPLYFKGLEVLPSSLEQEVSLEWGRMSQLLDCCP